MVAAAQVALGNDSIATHIQTLAPTSSTWGPHSLQLSILSVPSGSAVECSNGAHGTAQYDQGVRVVGSYAPASSAERHTLLTLCFKHLPQFMAWFNALQWTLQVLQGSRPSSSPPPPPLLRCPPPLLPASAAAGAVQGPAVHALHATHNSAVVSFTSPVVNACSDALTGFRVQWVCLGGGGHAQSAAGSQVAEAEGHARQLLSSDASSPQALQLAVAACMSAGAARFRQAAAEVFSQELPIGSIQLLPASNSDLWLPNATDGMITSVPPASPPGAVWHVDLLQPPPPASAAPPCGEAREQWCAEHLLAVHLHSLQPHSLYAGTVYALNASGCSELAVAPGAAASPAPTHRPLHIVDATQGIVLFETLGRPMAPPSPPLLQGTGVARVALQWIVPQRAPQAAATLACELQVWLLLPGSGAGSDGRPYAVATCAELSAFPCEQKQHSTHKHPIESTACFCASPLPASTGGEAAAGRLDDTQCPPQSKAPARWPREGSRHYMKLQGLPHDTCVAVRWRCVNAVGAGPWSLWRAGLWTHGPPSVRMPAASCLQPLSSPSSITISFGAAVRGHHDAVISHYEARLAPVCEVANTAEALWQVRELGEGTAAAGPPTRPGELMHTLGGLESDSHYAVCVRAVNAVGQGEWSPPAYVWSTGPPTVPPQPPTIDERAFDGVVQEASPGSLVAQAHVVDRQAVAARRDAPGAGWARDSLLVCGVGVTCVQLQWMACELGHHDDPITVYRVVAAMQDAGGAAASLPAPAHQDVEATEGCQQFTCRFDGLEAGKQYSFALQAINAVGSGPVGRLSVPVQLLGRPTLQPAAPWISSAQHRAAAAGHATPETALGYAQTDMCEAARQTVGAISHDSLPLCWHHSQLASQSDAAAAPYDHVLVELQAAGEKNPRTIAVHCSVLQLACPSPLLPAVGGGAHLQADSTLDECSLQGLPPDTAFRARIAWASCAGCGPWSDWSRTLWTLGRPTTVPPALLPMQRGLDWLCLRWPAEGQVQLGHHDAAPHCVAVQWRCAAWTAPRGSRLLVASSEPDELGRCTVRLQGPDEQSSISSKRETDVHVSDLPFNTAFAVRLRFLNAVGGGDWGPWSDLQAPLAHTLGPPTQPASSVHISVRREYPKTPPLPLGANWAPLALDGRLSVAVVSGAAGVHDAPLTAVRITWIAVAQQASCKDTCGDSPLLQACSQEALQLFSQSSAADTAEEQACAYGACVTVPASDMQSMPSDNSADLDGRLAGVVSLNRLPPGKLLLLRVRFLNAAGCGPPAGWAQLHTVHGSTWTHSSVCFVSHGVQTLQLPPPQAGSAAARELTCTLPPPSGNQGSMEHTAAMYSCSTPSHVEVRCCRWQATAAQGVGAEVSLSRFQLPSPGSDGAALALHDLPPLRNKHIQQLSAGTAYVLQSRLCFTEGDAPEVCTGWPPPSTPMRPLQPPPAPASAALGVRSLQIDDKPSHVPMLLFGLPQQRSDSAVRAQGVPGCLAAVRLSLQVLPLSAVDLATRTAATQKDTSSTWTRLFMHSSWTLEVLCGASGAGEPPCPAQLLPLAGDTWEDSAKLQLYDIPVTDSGIEGQLQVVCVESLEQVQQVLAALPASAAQQAASTGTADHRAQHPAIRGVLRFVIACTNSAGSSAEYCLPWMPVRSGAPPTQQALQRYAAALQLCPQDTSPQTALQLDAHSGLGASKPVMQTGSGDSACVPQAAPLGSAAVRQLHEQGDTSPAQRQSGALVRDMEPTVAPSCAGDAVSSRPCASTPANATHPGQVQVRVCCIICSTHCTLDSSVCSICAAPLPTPMCGSGDLRMATAPPAAPCTASFRAGAASIQQWRRCCEHAAATGGTFPVPLAAAGAGPSCVRCGQEAAHLGCAFCISCGTKLP